MHKVIEASTVQFEPRSQAPPGNALPGGSASRTLYWELLFGWFGACLSWVVTLNGRGLPFYLLVAVLYWELLFGVCLSWVVTLNGRGLPFYLFVAHLAECVVRVTLSVHDF